MSFEIITDSAANLPQGLVEKHNITVVPLTYTVDGEDMTSADLSAFDGAAFYEALKGKTEVKTSLISHGRFCDYAIPLLRAGKDILYVGVSSGISGTYGSVAGAIEELRPLFPERKITAVDTLAASFGEGLQVLKAAGLRDIGYPLYETTAKLLTGRDKMCQVFTVDDLMFLKRGGRVSTASALVGTMLQIKPLLTADNEGRIIIYDKVRGRRAALTALADAYAQKAVEPESQTVAIAHGGCPLDAKYLADLIEKRAKPGHMLIEYYEPVTGSHVGPGTVALFFEGNR